MSIEWGGDKVSVTYCPGTRSLVLVPTEKNHSCSTVHSRPGEYHSRLPVEVPERQDELGVRTHHFQLCEHSVGPASGGSFCNTFFKATSLFLQLATGARSRGHRCFFTELDQYPRLCTSSLVPNFTSPSESSSRPSNSGTHHPIIAHTVMVTSLNEPPGRLSTPPAKDGRGNKAISELRLPNTGVTSSTGRLEALRQRFRAEKISDQAIELILSSWRDKTNSNYNSVWKAWESWCAATGVHPFLSGISNVLDFLAEKYAAGLKYHSLNCYRSALSSALLPVDGF